MSQEHPPIKFYALIIKLVIAAGRALAKEYARLREESEAASTGNTKKPVKILPAQQGLIESTNCVAYNPSTNECTDLRKIAAKHSAQQVIIRPGMNIRHRGAQRIPVNINADGLTNYSIYVRRRLQKGDLLSNVPLQPTVVIIQKCNIISCRRREPQITSSSRPRDRSGQVYCVELPDNGLGLRQTTIITNKYLKANIRPLDRAYAFESLAKKLRPIARRHNYRNKSGKFRRSLHWHVPNIQKLISDRSGLPALEGSIIAKPMSASANSPAGSEGSWRRAA